MKLSQRIQELQRMGFNVRVQYGSKMLEPDKLSLAQLNSEKHTTRDKITIRTDGSYKIVVLHKETEE